MKQVFADTGYWVAMFGPNDSLKGKAKTVSEGLGDVIIVTSEMVLTEFANYFTRFGPDYRLKVVSAIDGIRSNPNVSVIPQTSVQFQSALVLYRNRLDKDWSLTDCVSFATMKRHGVKTAFTFDSHFKQAGFATIP